MKEDLASSCLGVDTVTRTKKKKDKIIRKIEEMISLILKQEIESIKSQDR